MGPASERRDGRKGSAVAKGPPLDHPPAARAGRRTRGAGSCTNSGCGPIMERQLTGWLLEGREPSGEMRRFGKHIYDMAPGSSPIQVFDLDRQEVDVLRLQLLSNHGHEDFTCIYRLRVHGEPDAN